MWIDAELVAVRLKVVSLFTGYNSTQSSCTLGPFPDTGKKVSTYKLVRIFPGLFRQRIERLSHWRLWQSSSLFPDLLCFPRLCLQLVFLISQGKWQSPVHRELCRTVVTPQHALCRDAQRVRDIKMKLSCSLPLYSKGSSAEMFQSPKTKSFCFRELSDLCTNTPPHPPININHNLMLSFIFGY